MAIKLLKGFRKPTPGGAPSFITPEKREEEPKETEIKIDLLREQINAIREMSRAVDERLSRLNESIGEVREMSMNTEKDFRELELKTDKALTIIQETEPEKINAKMERTNAVMEKQQGRLDELKSVMDVIREKQVEISKKFALIQGAETLIQLNNEIREELVNLKKLSAKTERDADRVESIYVNYQKEFAEINAMKDRAESIEKLQRDIVKEIDEVRAKMQTFVDRKTLEDVKKTQEDVIKKIELMNKISAEVSMNRDKAEVLVNQLKEKLSSRFDPESAIKEIKKRIELVEKGETLSVSDDITKMKQAIRAIEGKMGFAPDFSKSLSELSRKISAIESRVEPVPAFLEEQARFRQSLRTLETKIISTPDQSKSLSELQKRISAIEKSTEGTSELGEDVLKLKQTFRAIEGKMGHEKVVPELSKKINEIQTELAPLSTAADDLIKIKQSLRAVEGKLASRFDVDKVIPELTQKLEKLEEAAIPLSTANDDIRKLKQLLKTLDEKVSSSSSKDTEISGIRNQILNIQEKLNSIYSSKEEFKAMTEKINEFEEKFSAIPQLKEVEKLAKRIDSFEQQLKNKSVEEELAVAADRITAVEKEITSMPSPSKGLDALNKRLNNVEEQLGAVAEQLESVQAPQAPAEGEDMSQRMDFVEHNIGALSTLREEILHAHHRIAMLEERMREMIGAMGSLATQRPVQVYAQPEPARQTYAAAMPPAQPTYPVVMQSAPAVIRSAPYIKSSIFSEVQSAMPQKVLPEKRYHNSLFAELAVTHIPTEIETQFTLIKNGGQASVQPNILKIEEALVKLRMGSALTPTILGNVINQLQALAVSYQHNQTVYTELSNSLNRIRMFAAR